MTEFNQDKSLQREMNKQTLELLISKGMRVNEVRRIFVVFYSNCERDVAILEKDLKKNGFFESKWEQSVREENPHELCLEACIEVNVSIDALNELTDNCVELALESCSEFDGWYTQA